MRRPLPFLALAILLVLASVAASDIVSDRVRSIDEVIIVNAPAAEVSPGAGSDRYDIAMTPSSVNLVSMWPGDYYRTMTPDSLSFLWQPLFGMGAVPAMLIWSDDQGEHGAPIQILSWDYDSYGGSVSFTARGDRNAGGSLRSFGQYDGQSPSNGRIDRVALYLDNRTAQVIRFDRDSDVADAAVQADSKIGGYCKIEPYTRCTNPFGTKAAGANLKGANLSHALMLAVNLASADLSRADLSYAELRSAGGPGSNFQMILVRAKLIDADLSDSKLLDVVFDQADMSGANLTRATFRGGRLYNANLTGANLTQATLELEVNLFGADLTDANLTGAQFKSTKNASKAVYCRTTMPDGSINNRDCK